MFIIIFLKVCREQIGPGASVLWEVQFSTVSHYKDVNETNNSVS